MSLRRILPAMLGLSLLALAGCSGAATSAGPSGLASIAPAASASVAASAGASMAASAPASAMASSAASPSVAASDGMSAGASAGASTGALPSGLEGFCAAFAEKIAPTWPNIDAATAVSLAPLVRDWATTARLEPVRGDVATIVAWLATLSASTTQPSTPPDVQTAFDHVKTFADTNC